MTNGRTVREQVAAELVGVIILTIHQTKNSEDDAHLTRGFLGGLMEAVAVAHDGISSDMNDINHTALVTRGTELFDGYMSGIDPDWEMPA